MGLPFCQECVGFLDLLGEPSLVVQADLQRSVVIRFGFPISGAFALRAPFSEPDRVASPQSCRLEYRRGSDAPNVMKLLGREGCSEFLFRPRLTDLG